MVWCRVDEKAREGETKDVHVVSPRVCEGIEAHGWKGTRTEWVVGKVGIVKYAWVCVYADVNVRS